MAVSRRSPKSNRSVERSIVAQGESFAKRKSSSAMGAKTLTLTPASAVSALTTATANKSPDVKQGRYPFRPASGGSARFQWRNVSWLRSRTSRSWPGVSLRLRTGSQSWCEHPFKLGRILAQNGLDSTVSFFIRYSSWSEAGASRGFRTPFSRRRHEGERNDERFQA